MLVPMLDMLNHQPNTDVHHFVFSASLEHSSKPHPHYVRKSRELDLRVVGVDNSSLLPKKYRPDSRQVLLQENQQWLKDHDQEDLSDGLVNLPYRKQR